LNKKISNTNTHGACAGCGTEYHPGGIAESLIVSGKLNSHAANLIDFSARSNSICK